MEARPGAMDVSALLTESDWIGGLAVHLVRDAHDAEDLAQDTRLAALRASVRGDRSLRPWLAAAARNGARMLWRSEGSRRAVESERAAIDASETARSPEELISTLETQELVMRFVRELPEDLSYVVLATFVEGRTPTEIAKLQGIPAGTVRWRKSEALRRLRERLETHFDGDRTAWVAALVPLARTHLRSVKTATAAAGAGSAGPLAVWFAMSATWKVASVLFVSALLLVAYRAAATPTAPHDSDVRVAGHAEGDVEPEGAVRPEAPLQSPSEIDGDAATRTPGAPVVPAASPGDGRTHVRLRVVDRSGAAVAGARVTPSLSNELQRSHDHLATSLTPAALASLLSGLDRTTDDGGEATWDTPLLESDGEVTFRATGPNHGTGETTALVRAHANDNVVVIELVPAGAIEGRIVHTDGSTPSKQMVFIVDHESPLLDEGTDAFEWLGSDLVAASIHTDPIGRFERAGLPEGRYVAATSALSGHDAVRSAPFDVRVGGVTGSIVLEVEPSELGEPKVLVLDASGAPLTTARIRIEGPSFTFSGTPDSKGEYGLATNYADFAGGKLTVTDRAGLHRARTIEPIPHAPQTITVRMEAVPSVERTFVLFGTPEREVEQFFATVQMSADHEQFQEGRGDRFALRLPTGASHAFDLRVHARGFVTKELKGLVAEGLSDPVEIQLEPDPGVAGRVLVDGAPRAGVRVHLHGKLFEGRAEVGGGDVSLLGGSIDDAVTGDDGRFRVFAPEEGELVLRTAGRRLADSFLDLGVVDPGVPRDDVEIEMGEGGRVEGVCRTADGDPAAGSIMMLCHPYLDSKRARVRRDGRFAFRRVPAGDWYLRWIESSEGGEFPTLRSLPEGWDYPTNCSVSNDETTTIDFDVEDPLDAEITGSWAHDGYEPGTWTITLNQATGWSDDVDPFVDEHSSEASPDADGRYSMPATSRAPASIVVRAAEMEGAFRRSVAQDELNTPRDTAVGIARLRFSEARPEPGAARRARLHWSEGGWAYNEFVDLTKPGANLERLVPAGIVEISWIDADGDLAEATPVSTSPGSTLEVQRR